MKRVRGALRNCQHCNTYKTMQNKGREVNSSKDLKTASQTSEDVTESLPQKCPEIIKLKKGRIESFWDGALAETHPIFSKDPTTLQSILYYGATRVKLWMFYFTFGNFDATFRFLVDTISLLAIAHYEDIRKYGIDRVLNRCLKSLLN